ncbi:MAG: hypothetical protein ACP5GX_02915 [Anaerolineae bacterium]
MYNEEDKITDKPYPLSSVLWRSLLFLSLLMLLLYVGLNWPG